MKHLKTTPTAPLMFYRSYSRRLNGNRESWAQMTDRCIKGLTELGKLTEAESDLIRSQMASCTALPSGRYMWCGGTEWSSQQNNFAGQYNCTSTRVDSIHVFGYLMDLAMQGTGTGAVLELDAIAKLPPIVTKINITLAGTDGNIGLVTPDMRSEDTVAKITGDNIDLLVGDSRRGWVDAYMGLIQLAATECPHDAINVRVDLSDVRPAGETLAGFGGTANPIKLPSLFGKVAKILNGAVGRQLTSIECCLLIDEAALVVVAGNIRRSAGIRQFSADDHLAATIKDNLWVQDGDGNWSIDPERDALRMANHTRVFHTKPTFEQCLDSVTKQYESGEGAIQWAGEAVARANADLLHTDELKSLFVAKYNDLGRDAASTVLSYASGHRMDDIELDDRLNRYGLNPCAEILLSDNFCNLAEVHLNTIDPFNFNGQVDAFKAASLSVAALLHHEFANPRYQKSRLLDPIVGVSFTGLFDFFVNLFGVEWLQWWQAGRPVDWGASVDIVQDSRYFALLQMDFIRVHRFDYLSNLFILIEQEYLISWRTIVFGTVNEYCDRHDIKRPNRCTTVQPAGSKSLLTGASPGWHPPKAARYIRRMTFGKNDPLALAAIDMGYNVIPSPSDKDDEGNLLDDPNDPRCTEWLVEILCAVDWADLPGVDDIDISKFSAIAQYDFYMQVQKYYTTHNTSATIELRKDEIESLATAIYQSIQTDEGYISAALLARFDDNQTYPRMPFEPIDKDRYYDECVAVNGRCVVENFDEALVYCDNDIVMGESGPSGCDSDKCLMPEVKR